MLAYDMSVSAALAVVVDCVGISHAVSLVSVFCVAVVWLRHLAITAHAPSNTSCRWQGPALVSMHVWCIAVG